MIQVKNWPDVAVIYNLKNHFNIWIVGNSLGNKWKTVFVLLIQMEGTEIIHMNMSMINNTLSVNANDNHCQYIHIRRPYRACLWFNIKFEVATMKFRTPTQSIFVWIFLVWNERKAKPLRINEFKRIEINTFNGSSIMGKSWGTKQRTLEEDNSLWKIGIHELIQFINVKHSNSNLQQQQNNDSKKIYRKNK